MIAFPYICGYPFKGLAASAVFKVPLFGHVMSLIGVIDAGRSSAEKHLKQGHTLGISTGSLLLLHNHSPYYTCLYSFITSLPFDVADNTATSFS